ncbi:MAG TPA: FadR/GntR family transcriptional regulator [Hypericibacter adhaerens]|jgi:GntR family transcriptional repressor for pyruvate dehydrogenase complex|uniref:Pyruvate dehydrogenase complex repressor n=1 Tax=Hypericibacter adhaerens TaxID=2602016 RepID=A0A5J6MTB3_9PROT|nr:FadR/GntR family transcriptional regulator [Hypericibacter adhaerens]QEX20367.1 GntR family transcriptional regulator [Hypericibacter adhaerens]HWA46579.1 FadR/GntR family transcriptional regulator [Hypericibacter adhaerens]
MFKPVTLPPARRLSDVVARQLEHLIVEGRLQPGEGLPSERELAKQIGVSRPSLREALSELRSRGLIEPARNGGAVVTELTRTSLTEPLSQMLERHPSAIRDLIEMRDVLEAHAAALAAERATAADIRKLEAALEAQIRGRSRNTASLAKRDLDFHQAIAQASHNIAILHTAHGLTKLIKVFLQRGYEIILAAGDAREGKAAVEAQHAAILDAIRARDPEAARRASHAHLHQTEHIWTGAAASPSQARRRA